MPDVFRVAWEDGTGTRAGSQHAVDYLTESAARVRMETLKASGISRRVMYRTEGDGMRGCWCSEHGKEGAA